MNRKTDLDLLNGFAQERDDAAFGEIVGRYVDLVHSAALRLVADPHLAEDVSQAVFVALAGQSAALIPKLGRGMPLSAWLHLTTRNLAVKCVRTEARRRAREQAALTMEGLLSDAPDARDESDPSTAWAAMAPHLDHALADLPHPDRDALFLRFFEGKTAREIGQRLGLSEAAAQKRVTRALDRLRDQFALRGVKVTASTVGAAIAAHAVSSAPAALAAGITSAALASSVAVAGPLTLGTLSQITSSVAMTKVQATILAAVVTAAAIPLGVQQTKLTQVRAELAAPNPAQPSVATAHVPAPATRESEGEEIARLQQDIQSLGDRAASHAVAEDALERIPAGPTLLVPGRAVPLGELVFAGTDTPEAALQSLMALARDGQVEGFLALDLHPPHEEEQEMLSTDEGRDRLVEALRAEVKSVESVEVLGRRGISETRLQLIVREARTTGLVTNTVSFGRTTRGWRKIL